MDKIIELLEKGMEGKTSVDLDQLRKNMNTLGVQQIKEISTKYNIAVRGSKSMMVDKIIEGTIEARHRTRMIRGW